MYGSTTTGTPEIYTIIANEIQLGPIPDGVQTIEMLFYKKISALSATNTTEAMLTDNPDIYLYGALLEAEPFIMNDERVGLSVFRYGRRDFLKVSLTFRHRIIRIVTQALPLE